MRWLDEKWRGSRPRNSRACAVWALLVTLGLAAPALAHTPPFITEVHWDEATGELTLLTNRGIITGSAETGFRLMCNQAYDVPSSERVDFARTADGALIVATSGGVLRTDDGGCSFSPVAPFGDVAVYAMTRLPSGDLLLVTGEQPGRVMVSTDDGASFVERGTLEPDLYVERVIAAPSQPMRLFADGYLAEANGLTHALLVSEDEGATWVRRDVPLMDNEGDVTLLAVSPTDPQTLLARTSDYAATGMDRLLLSTDAGQRYETLLTGNDLLGASFTADGTGLYATGYEGLWRSDDLGQTMVQDPTADDMSCAFERDGSLYVCGFYRGFVDGTDGLGRSDDAGATITPLVEFTDVTQPVDCGVEAPTTQKCDELWRDWQREFVGESMPPTRLDAGVVPPSTPPAPTPPVPTPPTPVPAPVSTPPAPTAPPAPAPPAAGPAAQPAAMTSDDGGCGCRVGPGSRDRHGRSGASALPGLMALLLIGLRRASPRR